MTSVAHDKRSSGGCTQGKSGKSKKLSTGQLLDEDFECKRRMAQGMCQTLGRPKDRDICRSTLQELATINRVSSVQVKLNVHKFMDFYLKALRWTQTHQPTAIYRQWYGDSFNATQGFSLAGDPSEVQRSDNSLGDMQEWLQEGKSYLAMKTYEDGSTVIYAAVANNPKDGWADNGLQSLAQRKAGWGGK